MSSSRARRSQFVTWPSSARVIGPARLEHGFLSFGALDHAFAIGLELALEIQLPLLEQLELLPVGELRIAENIGRPL
jgi:hypothetical protein